MVPPMVVSPPQHSNNGLQVFSPFLVFLIFPSGPFSMARWPRNYWTTLYTYLVIFIGFPVLCLLAYGFVRGWFF